MTLIPPSNSPFGWPGLKALTRTTFLSSTIVRTSPGAAELILTSFCDEQLVMLRQAKMRLASFFSAIHFWFMVERPVVISLHFAVQPFCIEIWLFWDLVSIWAPSFAGFSHYWIVTFVTLIKRSPCYLGAHLLKGQGTGARLNRSVIHVTTCLSREFVREIAKLSSNLLNFSWVDLSQKKFCWTAK